MLKRASQTNGLSGRAQKRQETNTAPITSTPPFLGGSDWLSDFERDQFSNDEITKEQRKREGSDGGDHRAKRDIVEDVEAFELLAQSMEIKHHGGHPTSDSRLANSSRTRSIRAERLPLTRTRSPGCADSCNNSAASIADAAAILFAKPAARAAATISIAPFPSAIS